MGSNFRSLIAGAERWAKKTKDEAVRATLTDVQRRIDAVTVKAQNREKSQQISWQEKQFLNAFYHTLAAGGYLQDMPEASKLLLNYLGTSPIDPLEIDSVIYRNSQAVKNEMERQKRLAVGGLERGVSPIEQRSGRLLADYKRLKYADNRFILHSSTQKSSSGMYQTIWKVEEHYDFEDFRGTSKNWDVLSKYSEFPFNGQKVKLYDGLSRYLVTLHLAKEFDYFATWAEAWKA